MSGQVIDRVDLADEAGSIVLYDWIAEEVKDGRNLMRIDAEGNYLEGVPADQGYTGLLHAHEV